MVCSKEGGEVVPRTRSSPWRVVPMSPPDPVSQGNTCCSRQVVVLLGNLGHTQFLKACHNGNDWCDRGNSGG